MAESRCKEYESLTRWPSWRLNWACKQNDMCACFEIDRRERLALPGTERYQKAVGGKKPKPLPSGREKHRYEISAEYKRLRKLPKKQLRAIVKAWAEEKDEHPTLSNKVVLQIAKDHVAKKYKPRKRWKRRK